MYASCDVSSFTPMLKAFQDDFYYFHASIKVKLGQFLLALLDL